MPRRLTIIIGSAEEVAQREPWNGAFDAADKLIYRALDALAETVKPHRHTLGYPAFVSNDPATVDCTRCHRTWLLTAAVQNEKSVVIVEPQGQVPESACVG